MTLLVYLVDPHSVSSRARLQSCLVPFEASRSVDVCLGTDCGLSTLSGYVYFLLEGHEVLGHVRPLLLRLGVSDGVRMIVETVLPEVHIASTPLHF